MDKGDSGMAGNGGSSKPGDGKRGRRLPPATIELTATPVPGQAAGQPEAPAEPPPELIRAEVAPPERAPAEGNSPPAPPAAMESPEHGGEASAVPGAVHTPPGAPPAGAATGRQADPEPPPPPHRAAGVRPWPILGAAGAALALTLAVALAVSWQSSVAPQPSEPPLADRLAAVEAQLGALAERPQQAAADPGEVAALGARLAAIESRLSDLAGRPAPQGADPSQATALGARLDEVAKRLDTVEQTARRLDDIAAQVAKIEAALAAPRPSAADPTVLPRIAALDAALKALLDRLAELEKRIGEAAAAARAADRHAETASEAAAQRAAATAADHAVRLALLATTLRAAVERGEPFAAELASLKSLVSDQGSLAPLEPFAAGGVPSATALARELSALVPALFAAVPAAPDQGSLLDRLKRTTGHLVRVRRVGEAPGDDAAAVVARIEVAAARGDIAGALAELTKLPPSARAPAEAWIRRATQRGAAVDAARRLAGDALAALRPLP
jgi:hypothetical protein